MSKRILITAGIVVVLLVAGLSGCGVVPVRAQLPSNIGLNLNSQPEGIWVTGQGKVSVTPDIAIVSLGISAQAVSVAEAQSQATGAMDKVMNALTSNGVDKKDIQTQSFNIQQVTRWDKDKEQDIVIGYRVTNVVTAKIRAIDKAGEIIDAVALAGGDLTRINAISFSVNDPKPYQDQARQKAMNDAKDKAEQLASLGGVTLGKSVYINEGSYATPVTVPAPVYKADAGATTTPISPGEMDITLSIQVIYAIQ